MKRLVLLLALMSATVTGVQAQSDRELALQPAGETAKVDLHEYRAFARDLADRLNQGDTSTLNAAFDVPVFLDRALEAVVARDELVLFRHPGPARHDRVSQLPGRRRSEQGFAGYR